MTRAADLRHKAQRCLEGAREALEFAASELSLAETAKLLGRDVSYTVAIDQAARFSRHAREFRAEAKDLVREARRYESRRCCCERGAAGLVCIRPVGHDGDHREGTTSWRAA